MLETEKLNLIVSKIDSNKNRSQGAQTEMKIVSRNRNAGVEKFYQEFYSKRFTDNMLTDPK